MKCLKTYLLLLLITIPSIASEVSLGATISKQIIELDKIKAIARLRKIYNPHDEINQFSVENSIKIEEFIKFTRNNSTIDTVSNIQISGIAELEENWRMDYNSELYIIGLLKIGPEQGIFFGTGFNFYENKIKKIMSMDIGLGLKNDSIILSKSPIQFKQENLAAFLRMSYFINNNTKIFLMFELSGLQIMNDKSYKDDSTVAHLFTLNAGISTTVYKS